MSPVLLLCVLLLYLLVPVSCQFGWLMDWLGLGDSQSQVVTDLDEIHMDAEELITSKGYPVENHWVTTKDGYILGLHRIPYGRSSNRNWGCRPVALLQHGLLGSSNTWLLNSPHQSLPFILADAGVDVWLGNNRGNPYSKKHTTLKPYETQFWDFSWDEMAQYDLPAEVDYILDVTQRKQLYFVGYSQGSTLGFAKFSEDARFAQKIKHFIALAPVARVGHITSALRMLVPFADEIKTFLDIFGCGAVDTSPAILKTFSSLMCTGFGEDICMQGLTFLMGDMNDESINKSRVDVYNAHLISSTSAKVLMHWAQNVKSGHFQHFDHGIKGNFYRYSQMYPPVYQPKNIRIPVALFTGGNDALADPTDVSWLLTQINASLHIEIPWYNHLGMVLGYDAKDLVYPYLIPVITGRPWRPGFH